MQSGNSGQHSVGLIPSLKLETMIDREGYRRTTQTNPTKLQHYYAPIPCPEPFSTLKMAYYMPFSFPFFLCHETKNLLLYNRRQKQKDRTVQEERNDLGLAAKLGSQAVLIYNTRIMRVLK